MLARGYEDPKQGNPAALSTPKYFVCTPISEEKNWILTPKSKSHGSMLEPQPLQAQVTMSVRAEDSERKVLSVILAQEILFCQLETDFPCRIVRGVLPIWGAAQ